MKLYKLDAFIWSSDFGCLTLTHDCYFESLDLAFSYLMKYCHQGLPWAVSLYNGFIFERYVARGKYE